VREEHNPCGLEVLNSLLARRLADTRLQQSTSDGTNHEHTVLHVAGLDHAETEESAANGVRTDDDDGFDDQRSNAGGIRGLFVCGWLVDVVVHLISSLVVWFPSASERKCWSLLEANEMWYESRTPSNRWARCSSRHHHRYRKPRLGRSSFVSS